MWHVGNSDARPEAGTTYPWSMTPYLQNAGRLSDAALASANCPGCIRWDRLASDPVVVSLGGQPNAEII